MALAAYEEAVRFYHLALQVLEQKVPIGVNVSQRSTFGC